MYNIFKYTHMTYVYQIYNNCSNQHHGIMYDPELKNIPNDNDRPEFMGWFTYIYIYIYMFRTKERYF